MDDKNQKITITALLVLVLLGLSIWAFTFNLPGGGEEATVILSGDENVPIADNSANKIVYTANRSFNEEVLKNDCRERGGEFNSCGSLCEEGGECVPVCAYTCEF